MKKLTLLTLLVCVLSTPAHASIQQGITAFENGNYPLAQTILSQESDSSYQKYLYLAQIASAKGKIDEAIELNSQDADIPFVRLVVASNF
jgi:hypothetical protein